MYLHYKAQNVQLFNKSNDIALNNTTNKVTVPTNSKSLFSENTITLGVQDVYNIIKFKEESKPSLLCFSKAFEAYKILVTKDLVENKFLTVIDFSLSSTVDRLWVIDMESYEVVINSLVAHGSKSGSEFATRFSNTKNSFQSSLGTYLTGEVYEGRNGLSLRLDGLNYGYNDLARKRGVVIHAADYVSKDHIENYSRLGRSQGCPAVSPEINAELIELIKNKSVLFIYHPNLESLSANKALKKLNLQSVVKRNI